MLGDLAAEGDELPKGESESDIAMLSRALAISNASWFYIAVVLTWILGFCICISREKYRRWLLGMEEPPEEPEREIPARSSLGESPHGLGTEQSIYHFAAAPSGASCVWQIICHKKTKPATELTLPVSEADSCV